MSERGEQRILVALFQDSKAVQQAAEYLAEQDCPMDWVSMLGRAYGVGDDPIGVYYPSAGERMRGWGKLGAFWGGLWGLLAGAAGMFVIPGLGPVLAAGPIVEALTGAAGGAALGGGAMAGAGAVSHLVLAMRHQGVPEEDVESLHNAIKKGHYLLLMRCRGGECPGFRETLERAGPQEVREYPFGR